VTIKDDPAPILQPRIAKDEPAALFIQSADGAAVDIGGAWKLPTVTIEHPLTVAAAEPDTRPPMNLTQINAKFGSGFNMSRAYIEETLGVPSSHTVKASVFWKASALPAICDALVRKADEVAGS
jgi:hypothetical protein